MNPRDRYSDARDVAAILTAEIVAALRAIELTQEARQTTALEATMTDAMLGAVNTIRTEAGLGAIDLADIARVQIQAAGQCDDWAKYTLYCAEPAAVGDRSARP